MTDQRLNLAIQHHLQGRLPEAETLYRQILAEQPDNPEANHNLGDIAVRSGKPQQAVPLLQKALMHDPQNPRNWHSLANTLIEAGFPDDALKVLEEGRALGVLEKQDQKPTPGSRTRNRSRTSQDTGLPEIAHRQFDDALALHRSGQTTKALRIAGKLAARYPGNAVAGKRYGQLLASNERYRDAIAVLQQAHQADPGDAEILADLAASLQGAGQFKDAETCYRRALSLAPDDATLHSNLAGLMNRLHRPDQARQHAIEALQLDPDYPEALNNLGNAYKTLNQLNRAKECFSRALKLKPDYFAAYTNLGNLYRDAQDLEQAEALYDAAARLRPNHAETFHNLGTIYKDTRRPEQAVEAYHKAAKLAPERLEHIDALSEFIRFSDPADPLIRRLTRVLENQQITGRDQAFALFVLGKAMLDLGRPQQAFEYYRLANEASHPHAEAAPSFAGLLEEYRRLFTDAFRLRTDGFGLSDVPQILVAGYSRSGKSLIESILEAHPGMTAEGEKRRLIDFSQQKMQDANGHVQLGRLQSMTAEQSRADARDYLERFPNDGQCRINTLPGNNYALGALSLWLPKVPIIFCRRDLMDMGLACYFKRYEKGNRHTYKLEELGRHIRVYDDFMRLWLKVLPNPMLEVQYETLVRSPETEGRRIYEFLGLEWRPEYLDFLNTHKELAANIGLAHSLEAPAPIRADFIGTANPFLDQLTPLRESYESAVVAETPQKPG